MHKHTPGPWTAEARHKTAINAGDKHIAMVNFWNHPDKTVCINEEEHQANVALISAAPEMLKALEDYLEDYLAVLASGDNGTWDPEFDLVYVNARNAVAKAKGEHHAK